MQYEQANTISQKSAIAGKTAKQAFDEYRKEIIDLDPKQTEKARSSREYLKTQLFRLAEK